MSEQRESHKPSFPNTAHGGNEANHKYQEERDRKDDAYKGRQLDIESKQLITNSRIAAYTLVLAILTALGTIVSWLSSRAAQEGAVAAKMAADTATKALTTDERAWVGFHGMDTQLQAGKPIQSRITFTNTGRTPAKTLRAAAAIEILPVGTSPSFALDDAPLSTNYSVVFPNNSAQVTVPDVSGRLSKTVATKEMVLAINGGTYVVYVHGRVSYDDIFDNHHWLTFCTQTTADLLTWNMCPSGSPSGNDLDK